MSHDKVCSWLQLPLGGWPPDHYTLLGLEPGEVDAARLESQVHDRLQRLRRHQLQDPEPVTEAMNLLARAYSCLIDPEAKRRYDASLLESRAEGVPPAAAPPPETNGATPEEGAILPAATAGPVDPLAWLFGPWNPQAPGAPEGAAPPRVLDDWSAAPPPPRLPTSPRDTAIDRAGETVVSDVLDKEASPPQPVDHVVRGAHSASARRGLATKRALYHRIARTRELLEAWQRAGKYLNHPDRPLIRSSEAVELTRLLQRICRLLSRFPPLLGEAGQPGFYVVTLAGQPKPMIVPTFRMLLPLQRETLGRDWRDGLKLLTAHREFLRTELRALRRTRWWGRVIRAADVLLTDHPGLFLLLTLLAAIAAAALLSFAR